MSDVDQLKIFKRDVQRRLQNVLSKLDDGTRVVWYNHYRETFEKMWARKGRAKKVGNPDFASIISSFEDDEKMLEYFQAEAKKHFGVDIVTSMQDAGGARPSALGHGGYLPASRSSAFGPRREATRAVQGWKR